MVRTLQRSVALCTVWTLSGIAHGGLPGDCIAVVRMESLDAVTKQAGEFLSEVDPAVNEHMLGVLLGQMVRNPMLAGVDRSRPWWVAFMAPMQYGRKPAVLVPLTATEPFEGALAMMMAKGETVDGVTSFSIANGRSVTVGLAETCAVVSRSKDACQALLALWNAGEIQSDLIPLKPSSSLLTATIDTAKLWTIYKPAAMGMIQGLQLMVSQRMAQAAQAQGTDPKTTMALLKARIDSLVAVADQSEQVSLALVTGKQGANLEADWRFKEGSPVANFLSAQKPQELKLLKHLPIDVVLAAGFRLDGMDQLMGWHLESIEKLLDDSGREAVQAIKGQVQAWGDSLSGDGAVAMVPPGDGSGLEGVYVLGLKDGADAEKNLISLMSNAEAVKMLRGAMGRNADIQFEPNVATYKEKPVHRQTTTFNLDTMPHGQREALRRMFGQAVVTEMAVVDDKVVMAFGSVVRQRLEQSIDSILDDAASFAASSAVIDTFGSLPTDQSMIAFASVVDLLEWIRLISPVPIPDIAYESSTGIGLTAKMSGRSVRTNLIVPIGEAVAIREAAMQARQGQ